MSVTLWTDKTAARATGGKSTGEWKATNVVIDSRSIRPGDLFCALKGDRFDGHDFCADALQKGAAAVLVDHLPQGLNQNAPRLEVGDTLQALCDLGTDARNRSKATLVAVTGSVGKTGTKESLKLSLSVQGKVHATFGNLNNHIGAPLTLSRMDPTVDWGVFEMGMNHAGEIAPLSRLVRPHVAVITNINPVHIENFASIEGIADAKAEIFEGVEPGGTAVLNSDQKLFDRLAASAKRAGIDNILKFGALEDADMRLIEAVTDTSGVDVKAELYGEPLEYRVGAPGEHWAMNSLAVLGAVHAMGADVEKAAKALAQVGPQKGRGQQTDIVIGRGESFRLIDESYNASPPAVKAALAILRDSALRYGGRRIAVLGDMLELGDRARALHEELAPAVLDAEVEQVFTVGENMALLRDKLPATLRARHGDTAAEIAGDVAATVQDGDVVLVKGSLGMGMKAVIEALEERAVD
ncbi:MAG: UDP-N-acetylmuramoyl-tripeptide--D-alanyl-D-alanine ligase [Alphaproteobacteria bacterium]|nr:UDP-N-acetylmuramoyl-tripeptide--D-alanyl-D-alanine ligase [Alphaproteobacteria bacterium]